MQSYETPSPHTTAGKQTSKSLLSSYNTSRTTKNATSTVQTQRYQMRLPFLSFHSTITRYASPVGPISKKANNIHEMACTEAYQVVGEGERQAPEGKIVTNRSQPQTER
jgi:hypothetical protein